MSVKKSGNVAVFWDYENCPAPASTSGYAIANSISALARSFGSVKVFKAYLEISDQSRPSLRSELQSSGVSLVDCPHNGRKDVADKMILVDMLSYAIDNPAPATIVLITGDRDFAYALSVLKNRRYKIVLVKRPVTHVSLTFQACVCFDWFNDIVHQADKPSSQTEKTPQRPPYQRHRDSVCNVSASRPSSHSASEDSSGSGADTGIVHFLRDRTSDRPPALQEPPQVSTATCESPRQDREISSSPRQQKGPLFSEYCPSNSASVQKDFFPKHRSRQPETLPGSSSPTDNSPIIEVQPMGHGDANIDITTPMKFLVPANDVFSSISPLSSPFVWPPPAPPMTPNSSVSRLMYEGTGKSAKARSLAVPTMSVPTMSVPTMSVEALAAQFLKKKPANNTSPMIPSSTSIAMTRSTSAVTTHIVKPGIVNGNSVVQKPMNGERTNGSSSSRTTSQAALGSGQSTEPPDTPVVPPHFVILVEALQWQRSQGVFTPYRGTIAERIGMKGTTYKKAGVSSFREYSLLAEQAGIVDMGGTGGRDWIRLKPGRFFHLVAK